MASKSHARPRPERLSEAVERIHDNRAVERYVKHGILMKGAFPEHIRNEIVEEARRSINSQDNNNLHRSGPLRVHQHSSGNRMVSYSNRDAPVRASQNPDSPFLNSQRIVQQDTASSTRGHNNRPGASLGGPSHSQSDSLPFELNASVQGLRNKYSTAAVNRAFELDQFNPFTLTGGQLEQFTLGVRDSDKLNPTNQPKRGFLPRKATDLTTGDIEALSDLIGRSFTISQEPGDPPADLASKFFESLFLDSLDKWEPARQPELRARKSQTLVICCGELSSDAPLEGTPEYQHGRSLPLARHRGQPVYLYVRLDEDGKVYKVYRDRDNVFVSSKKVNWHSHMSDSDADLLARAEQAEISRVRDYNLEMIKWLAKTRLLYWYQKGRCHERCLFESPFKPEIPLLLSEQAADAANGLLNSVRRNAGDSDASINDVDVDTSSERRGSSHTATFLGDSDNDVTEDNDLDDDGDYIPGFFLESERGFSA